MIEPKLTEPQLALTVAELIRVLQAFPPTMRVALQGCDCEGPCSGAEVDTSAEPAVVVITRDDDLAYDPICKMPLRGGKVCGLPAKHKGQHHVGLTVSIKV